MLFFKLGAFNFGVLESPNLKNEMIFFFNSKCPYFLKMSRRTIKFIDKVLWGLNETFIAGFVTKNQH
jgi:hypothetical protein